MKRGNIILFVECPPPPRRVEGKKLRRFILEGTLLYLYTSLGLTWRFYFLGIADFWPCNLGRHFFNHLPKKKGNFSFWRERERERERRKWKDIQSGVGGWVVGLGGGGGW